MREAGGASPGILTNWNGPHVHAAPTGRRAWVQVVGNHVMIWRGE